MFRSYEHQYSCMIKKLFAFILKRKVLSFFVIVLFFGSGWYGYRALKGTPTEIRYVTATAQKGTIINAVSGSGQIAVLNQVDIKTKGSATLMTLPIVNGQAVKAGDLLAQLDTREAYKAVRDADANLQSATLALQKATQPATASELLQAENALTSARNTVEKLRLTQLTEYQKKQEAIVQAEDTIAKTYEDSYNSISNAYLNIPTIITDLYNFLYSKGIVASDPTLGSASQWNISVLLDNTGLADKERIAGFQRTAEADYATARKKYDASFENYKNSNRYSDRNTIDALLAETLETTKAVAQATKSESNYFDAWADYRSRASLRVFSTVQTYQSNLSTAIGQTSGHLSSLIAIQNTLQTNRQTALNANRDLKQMDQNNPLDLVAAEASVKEREVTLATLRAGTLPLDIQSQQLTVKARQNALQDAQEKLADYVARAPSDGIIAKVHVMKGDTISAGTVIATLIAKQRIAQISLNEIDAAKIMAGQKVTLTFDAIDDLSITGQVADIDTLGTVTQGVVTYAVKITFDTQDDRVKPGMSVSAAIVTDVHQDVLSVPNGAVKTQGTTHYVELFNPPLVGGQGAQGVISEVMPQRQTVEIGVSNDTLTEIRSGLSEQDQVVIRTITSGTVKAAAAAAPSLFGGGGGGGGGTGAVRIPRGG